MLIVADVPASFVDNTPKRTVGELGIESSVAECGP
jgi:hypothetical protein